MKFTVKCAANVNKLDNEVESYARSYAKSRDISFDDALEEVWGLLSAWFIADEYVVIEIDLDNATAHVLDKEDRRIRKQITTAVAVAAAPAKRGKKKK